MLLGFVVAYQFTGPLPPERITIAAGSKDGAYTAFAKQYRSILARNGIELIVRNTAGSMENLKLLQSNKSGVDVAFVQSGTGGVEKQENLVSLGSVYYEPIWVFTRGDTPVKRIAELRGKRIAIGPPGSGTRTVALQLLSDNGMTIQPDQFSTLGGNQAVDGLLTGKVDAVFTVPSVRSSNVQKLLKAGGVQLMTFERAAAYIQYHTFLSRLMLPEGVIDLKRNFPPRDTALLASTANLVARKDFHPALSDLLLQVASEVHSEGGLFEKRGEFPSSGHLDFPLSKEAERFFKFGPPFLQRFMPFWAATLVDRLKVMLLPFIILLIPLLKIVPPAYNWRVRSKIYRPYKDLQDLDARIRENLPIDDLDDCMAELKKIEFEVKKINVPLSYSEPLYNLRLHIELLATKIRDAREHGSK
jgi:TRAP transporter TAXI family solute receptor